MSFEIVEKSKVLREIIVTIPGDVVRRVESKIIENTRKTLKMDGFRKGKVPASLIRQRAGESITEDARRESLQEAVREALDTIDNLLHVGEVEVVTPKTDDGGFVAKVNAEIAPVIEVKDYKGLEISEADVFVTDEMVDAELEKKRDRLAVIEPVEDRKIVEDGDVLMVTLSDPNDAAKKFCSAGDRQITVGKGFFNADMEKALIGAEIGNPVEVKANVDDAEAVVTVKVNEIKKRVLPALDDAFALDTGEAENLAELREKTRKDVTAEKENERKASIEKKLLAKLREANAIDMPEGYVKARAVQAMRLQLEQMLRQQVNDDFLDRIAQNIRPEELEEYRIDYHNEIILNAVAADAKIEVSDDDVLAEAKDWFKGMAEDKIKAWLNANNANKFVGDQVKRDRALKLIVDEAKITKE